MGWLKFAINWKHTGLFAAGVAFGTAGVKLLSSRDAKKVYTSCTAAALRAKDSVMKTVSNIQENAQDIYEEAKAINEARAEEEESAVYEDFEEESCRGNSGKESTGEALQEGCAQEGVSKGGGQAAGKGGTSESGAETADGGFCEVGNQSEEG